MAPDIPLDKQRPAEYVFSRHVQDTLSHIHEEKKQRAERADAAD
jgi:hypothetical protein